MSTPKPLKIGILGYGRMGKMVEQSAIKRGHTIVAKVDQNDALPTTDVDVYIDFTTAEALANRLPQLNQKQTPVVIGTTGWNNKKETYAENIAQANNKAIWSGNFSVGVNLFWQMLREAQKKMSAFEDQYDVMSHEFHHKNKIDSPSGTALQTGQIILEESSVKEKIVIDALQRAPKANELHLSSTRGGAIPGTHTVIWDSLFDTIELTHTARSREGFALGSVLAAEYLIHKHDSTGLINFTEIFDQLF